MLKTQSLASSLDEREIKICVYGDAGTGKTRLIATLPGKKLVLSAEAGLLSLEGVPTDGIIETIAVKSVAQLVEIHAHLKAHPEEWDWVCLDSISEIAEIALAELKKKTKDPRAAYGDVHDHVLAMLRDFRDLPMGVYFSAKQKKEKDEGTGRISYGISMPGSKLSPAIPYIFDEVLRTEVVDEKTENGTVRSYWLLTANDGRSTAKDRSGKLDPYEEHDLGAIAAKIRGPKTSSVIAANE